MSEQVSQCVMSVTMVTICLLALHLENGADKTPIDIAEENSYEECLELVSAP